MAEKISLNDRKYVDKQLKEWNSLFLKCGQEKPKVDDWLDKFLHIIHYFFSGWDIEYMNDCTMDRYLKLKRVWEVALKNVKKQYVEMLVRRS